MCGSSGVIQSGLVSIGRGGIWRPARGAWWTRPSIRATRTRRAAPGIRACSELWLSRRCDQLTVDGYVTCLLLASLFTGAEWLSRASGQYLFRVTDAADGSVGTMCWGYFALTD